MKRLAFKIAVSTAVISGATALVVIPMHRPGPALADTAITYTICDVQSPTAPYIEVCGAVRNDFIGFLMDLQPSTLFLKWKAANPGEWSRLQAYAADSSGLGTPPDPETVACRTFTCDYIRDAISMAKMARSGSVPLPAPSTQVAASAPVNISPPVITVNP